MWLALRRLSLGLFLIVLTSGILLLSDWNRRQPPVQKLPRVALLQHASQSVLDEGVQGMLQGLGEVGFVEGQTLSLRRFNAENDLPTANAIAKEMTSGSYDLLLTASTLSLQTVAKANIATRKPHVFSLVTDPYGAGVGINRENTLDHPPYLAGYGTRQPVEEAFRLAQKMLPSLSLVGVVWNPAESNSEASVLQARAICRDLAISLLEAPVDNSSGVFEATNSLIGRGVQALWIGGDVTVLVAADALMGAAKAAHLPVFSNIPSLASKGALFDLGANYHEVGRLAGVLAGQVLKGRDPATIPVENVVPEKLMINQVVLEDLKDPWQIPESILTRADVLITAGGVQESPHVRNLTPPPGLSFRVGIVYFAPDPAVELGLQGFLDGLKDLQFVQGRNLELLTAHAQGEMVNIPTIIQSFLNERVDLIVPLTTPVLTAAAGLVKTTPVIFSVVYDPIAAGAGASPTDHLPNITGVGSFPPVEETVVLVQQLVPDIQTVGTLYNSSEANSRKVVGVARELFAEAGITLEEVTISNSSEVFQAAQAVATRAIQALWITGDNTAFQAFDGIVKVANDFKLPLIINDPEFMKQGALACAGLGFFKAGYAAASLAARVLLGENPHQIPFGEVKDKRTCINFEAAHRLGITFHDELLQKANHFTNISFKFGRPATIAWISQRSLEPTDAVYKGFLKGLTRAGLIQDKDFMFYHDQIAVFSKSEEVPRLGSGVDLFLAEDEAIKQKLLDRDASYRIISLTGDGTRKEADKANDFVRGETLAMRVARALAQADLGRKAIPK